MITFKVSFKRFSTCFTFRASCWQTALEYVLRNVRDIDDVAAIERMD